jgi:hypothetical protein
MDFEVYESGFNNEVEPSESPKPQPLKKYDETVFDPDLYGCWFHPKWTPEGQAEAVSFRRAKIEKVPRIKVLKVAVKKSEIKARVLEMKNGAGRAKAAFLSLALAILVSSCSVEPQRPYIVSVYSDSNLADFRGQCDSFSFIPKNCASFGEDCPFCLTRVKVWVDGKDMTIEGEEIQVHGTVISEL